MSLDLRHQLLRNVIVELVSIRPLDSMHVSLCKF